MKKNIGDKIKEKVLEILSEYDPRQKRMVLSSKRVCGFVSHFVCLLIISWVTIRDGMSDSMQILWSTEIIGTLALLGITQFGKYNKTNSEE